MDKHSLSLGKYRPLFPRCYGESKFVGVEVWLVTNVARSTDGFHLKVCGLSDYVRDQPGTFCTVLNEAEGLIPRMWSSSLIISLLFGALTSGWRPPSPDSGLSL